MKSTFIQGLVRARSKVWLSMAALLCIAGCSDPGEHVQQVRITVADKFRGVFQLTLEPGKTSDVEVQIVVRENGTVSYQGTLGTGGSKVFQEVRFANGNILPRGLDNSALKPGDIAFWDTQHISDDKWSFVIGTKADLDRFYREL
jgi:hypothetical protein